MGKPAAWLTLQLVSLIVLSLIAANIWLGGFNFHGLQDQFQRTSSCWRQGSAVSRGLLSTLSCEALNKPPGTEALPRGMIVRTSDFHLRRLYGHPSEDAPVPPPRYLLAMTVSARHMANVDAMVSKFPPELFALMLFHYDDNVDAYRALEWSARAVHVSALKQSKWWFAKRFLHPDIVASYDYIFLWDEDLGLDNFDPVKYLDIVRGADLDLSQPALAPGSAFSWAITLRVPPAPGADDRAPAYHSRIEEGSPRHVGTENCTANSTEPPCAGFIEIMAPVYSRQAWRCLWHMIRNELIHGWGLDWPQAVCARTPHFDHIGIVDSEYIRHLSFSSMSGDGENQTLARKAVRSRAFHEQAAYMRMWEVAQEAEAMEAAAEDQLGA